MKRFLACLLTLLCLAAFPAAPAAFAASPDASLTLHCAIGGTAVPGVECRLYRVASLSGTTFTAADAFQPAQVALNGLTTAAQWQTAADSLSVYAAAEDSGIAPDASAQTDASGSAVFSGLTTGLYLAVFPDFLAVANEGSLTGAAEALHLTQPTLSRQMKELETSLGKQLFIRGRRITLTEDGILLRGRAKEILNLMQKTEKEISGDAPVLSGDIYLGAAEARGVRAVLKTAAKFQSEYPGIRFHLASGSRETLMDRLNKGLDDFTLCLGKPDLARYGALRLPAADRWGVLLRRDDPLAARTEITPRDLSAAPLVLSAQAIGCAELFRWLGKPERSIRLSAAAASAQAAALMAAEGMGPVLTLEGLAETDSSLVFRPLSGGCPAAVSVIWKKYAVFSEASSRFLDRLQQDYP